MLKVAIVGYGGIAGAHAPAWQLIEGEGKAKLVAVCDINPAKFTMKQNTNISTGKELDPSVHTYTDYLDMLAHEELDLVDICLPTPLHKSVTIDILNHGINVQCEKPMARTYKDALEMIEAARRNGKHLMIGQGLRFSNEYVYLKNLVESGEYGKPVSAVFQRVGEPPRWGTWENWYMDHDRSGGCLLDMHIHDVDMIRHLFGEPKAVSCVTSDLYSGDDIAQSRFLYDGISVMAIGDWSNDGSHSFYSGYRVAFEKASVHCDNGCITIYPRDGGDKIQPELTGDNFFANELRFVTELVAEDKENLINPPEGAAKSVRLVEFLKESANQNGAFISCEEL